ncbi:hypothetical protein F0A17_04975 [Billgrantia pellis]|uniref:Uncharacterized protein n=1 Tax=Billgrantia pellis TaxID=2606936 RepID=A0A7V7G269_9GAMM|nr:hypothetical protein F0A17_04975 [Halomonas pellis]
MRPGKASQVGALRWLDSSSSLHWGLTPLICDVIHESWRIEPDSKESCMRNIIYIIGLIVVVLFILSMLGLR